MPSFSRSELFPRFNHQQLRSPMPFHLFSCRWEHSYLQRLQWKLCNLLRRQHLFNLCRGEVSGIRIEHLLLSMSFRSIQRNWLPKMPTLQHVLRHLPKHTHQLSQLHLNWRSGVLPEWKHMHSLMSSWKIRRSDQFHLYQLCRRLRYLL